MSRALLFATTSLLAVMAVVLPNQSPAGPHTIASRPGTPVLFIAHDYGYTGPDRIPAGMTTLEILNQGQDLHHAQLIKLAAGKTPQQFAAAMKADPIHWPAWVHFVGGPNAVMPGERAMATMRLDPGNYLVLCIIPDEKGVPHIMLGMERPLTVTPATTVSLEEPVSDLTITQRDFLFDLSRPITAGTHTIQVMNGGTQPHEAVLVQLAPGATAKDFIAAFEPGAAGPPPGRTIGGIVGLDRGGRGYFTSHLEQGRYALICFFPDQTTGRPHFAQGMISEFTVR